MHGGCELTGSVLAAANHTLSFLFEKDDASNLDVTFDVGSNATFFLFPPAFPLAEMVK